MTTILERPSETQAAPSEFHWTTDTFYRALDARVFKHPERLELIHGRIIENMGQSPLHASLRRRVARMLRAALASRFYVCEETPLHIVSDGEPTPDASVLTGTESDYADRHPTPADAVLLIEIAVSTMDYDLGEKALLYASAGVAEYWVVLPSARHVVVHRAPSTSGYSDVAIFTLVETISFLDASFSLAALFDA